MTISNNPLSILISFITTGALVAIAVFLYFLVTTQQELLRVNKDQHIFNLYSVYKANMDSCKSLASQANKDGNFIKENCIDVINSSLVGKGLQDWGRSDLFITK